MKYSEYLRDIRAIVETSPNTWLCLVAASCPDTAGGENHRRLEEAISRALGATSASLPAALVRDGLIEPFSVPPDKDGYTAHGAATHKAWCKQVRLDWLDKLIASAEMGTMSPA